MMNDRAVESWEGGNFSWLPRPQKRALTAPAFKHEDVMMIVKLSSLVFVFKAPTCSR